jgi:hypothetical protein
MFEQLCMCKQGPYLLTAKDDGQLFGTSYGRKMQVLIRQSFGFEQEAQSVNGVFEVRLRRRMAALLQLVQIIFYLFRIELRRQALKVEGGGSNVTAIVVKGAGASSKDRDVTFKALKQYFKSANFTTGTVEVLVIP